MLFFNLFLRNLVLNINLSMQCCRKKRYLICWFSVIIEDLAEISSNPIKVEGSEYMNLCKAWGGEDLRV